MVNTCGSPYTKHITEWTRFSFLFESINAHAHTHIIVSHFMIIPSRLCDGIDDSKSFSAYYIWVYILLLVFYVSQIAIEIDWILELAKQRIHHYDALYICVCVWVIDCQINENEERKNTMYSITKTIIEIDISLFCMCSAPLPYFVVMPFAHGNKIQD